MSDENSILLRKKLFLCVIRAEKVIPSDWCFEVLWYATAIPHSSLACIFIETLKKKHFDPQLKRSYKAHARSLALIRFYDFESFSRRINCVNISETLEMFRKVSHIIRWIINFHKWFRDSNSMFVILFYKYIFYSIKWHFQPEVICNYIVSRWSGKPYETFGICWKFS